MAVNYGWLSLWLYVWGWFIVSATIAKEVKEPDPAVAIVCLLVGLTWPILVPIMALYVFGARR